MRRNNLIALFILLLSLPVTGQQSAELEGRVVDENHEPLMSATVVLLQQKDSVIAKFAITDASGNYALKRVSPDDYILQVSYVGYNSYSRAISLSGKENKMEDIVLKPESVGLDEVVIKAEHIPIVINGDTIEYNAAAFSAAPDAPVEELLKKLPGVEVARDGSIKAQGEQVTKVMVDGKEFFGNDPTIATKNLPADAVDKVQVFDKKSELATFSGIDDGQEQKTINLKLKEDKKHGYFGNAEAGYGTDNRYAGKFNLNRFGSQTQMTALGMMNNTNKQGFSFNDYINFMGGFDQFLSRGGFTFNTGEDADIPLASNGQDGLTTIRAGGINLNSDLSKKTTLNTHYFYNQTLNTLEQSIDRQTTLEELSYRTLSDSRETNNKNNHRLGLTLKHRIDSLQKLTFEVNTGYNTTQRALDATTATDNEALHGNTEESDSYDRNKGRMKGSLRYYRRFAKKGRLFTAKTSFQFLAANRKRRIHSTGDYIDTLDQRQLAQEHKRGYGLSATYTEPAGKYKYLQFSLSRQEYNNGLDKSFYDITGTEESLNQELGNAYKVGYVYHQIGTNFRYNRKRINLETGIKWQLARLSDEVSTRRDFRYLLPSLQVRYDFKQGRNLNIDYRTEVREPTVRQLQPVIDNSDPLNIYEGNPDLVPAYTHELNAFFMDYNQFNFSSLFANVMMRYSRNEISYRQTTDSLLITTIQPVNVADNLFANGSISYNTPIRPIKSKINLETGINLRQNITLINGLESHLSFREIYYDISLENRKKDIVDAMLGAKFTFNRTRAKETDFFNQNYSRQTYYLDIRVRIGSNWRIKSSLDYQVYSNESFGGAQNIPLWGAEVSRYVMNKKGVIKFSAFDLLNKNVGIRRISDLNYTQEQRIRSIGRHFLVSFGYSIAGFDKRGGVEVEVKGL